MDRIAGVIVGLVVFGIWMNIVGNPYVVETVLGVVISFAAGFWVYREIRKRKGRKTIIL
jgi:putative flippase GtrA